MYNQLKTEFYKLFHSAVFYIVGLLYVAAGISFSYKMHYAWNISDIYYPFADSLQDVSLSLLTAIFVAQFIGQDFTNRTLHHEIAGGCSRYSIVITRAIPVVAASVFFHILFVSSEVIGMGIFAGFSFDGFSNADVLWIFTVMLQVSALSLVFCLISFLAGGLFAGTAATVIFELVMCNMLRNFVTSRFYTYSCFCFASNNNSEMLSGCAIYSAVLIPTMLFLTYLVFRKKEI